MIGIVVQCKEAEALLYSYAVPMGLNTPGKVNYMFSLLG